MYFIPHLCLGQSQKSLGNLQQALVCLEKRLVVAHELGSSEAKAAAYGELGQIHATLSNLEQAVSCLDHQRAIALELCKLLASRGSERCVDVELYLGDRLMEAEAISGLGTVYQQMGEYSTALRYHQNDLDIAEQLGTPTLQSRACGNIGINIKLFCCSYIQSSVLKNYYLEIIRYDYE